MNEKILLEAIHEHCRSGQFMKNTRTALCLKLQVPKMELSSALKALSRDRKIVQISARPAFYLSRSFLIEQGIDNAPDEASSIQELMQFKKEQKTDEGSSMDAFASLIGAESSLKKCVNQMKATLSYPPDGLPILLTGPTGTGKSLLAKTAWKWAVGQKLLKDGGQLVTINCSEYANNPELLTANLFGYVKGAFTGAEKDHAGLVSQANGGILFLDEVHNLRFECQEKLFLLMDQGIYHMMGDNEHWHSCKCRIIFATTEDPEVVLLKTLMRRIPVRIQVPSLMERSYADRIRLIWYLYDHEAKALKKEIFLSPSVLSHLLYSSIPGNIGGLKSTVQYSCISSLYESQESRLYIRLQHLPDAVLANPVLLSKKASSKEWIGLKELRRDSKEQNSLLQMLDEILLLGKNNPEPDMQMMNQAKSVFVSYLNRWEKLPASGMQQRFYAEGILQIASRMHLTLDEEQASLLGAFCLEYDTFFDEISTWSMDNQEEAADFLERLQLFYFQPSRNGVTMAEYMNQNMELTVLPVFLILLSLYLYEPESRRRLKNKAAIILAHGRSTASSIAEAVNQMLEENVFDAMDMPVYMDFEQIAEQLKIRLERMGRLEELYLLVDMGSLMDLPKRLILNDTDVAIINNISTLVALQVGSSLLQGHRMDQLIQQAASPDNFVSRIYPGQHKKPAIICSCASGIGTAMRLQELLKNTLPEDAGLELPVVPFESLKECGLNLPELSKLQVIGIVGTLDPQIPAVPFTGMESLILQEEQCALLEWLAPYLRPEQLQVVQPALVRSFSLSNLMGELTILNPSKLLEMVSSALDQLQRLLDQTFKQSTCFGLYIHICCMIERLVLNRMEVQETPVTDAAFVSNARDFHEAFAAVEAFYRVIIPDSEIKIVWSYINNDLRPEI